jgi:hypothetical protein
MVSRETIRTGDLLMAVRSWLELARVIGEQRRVNTFNPLFSFDCLREFSDLVDQFEVSKSSLPELEVKTIRALGTICEDILNGCKLVESAGTAVDSISSLSHILYFLDMGYEIFAGILHASYNEEEREPYFPVLEVWELAYDNVVNKRNSLVEYFDPYGFVDREQSEDDWLLEI